MLFGVSSLLFIRDRLALFFSGLSRLEANSPDSGAAGFEGLYQSLKIFKKVKILKKRKPLKLGKMCVIWSDCLPNQ